MAVYGLFFVKICGIIGARVMFGDFIMQQVDQQYQPQPGAPVATLRTNRSMLKTVLLSMITFGIYGIIVFCGVANDLNTIAGRYDGKRTMHFALLLFIIGPITMGIGYIVWYHKICNRIGNELNRRNAGMTFSATDYWLWSVLGSCIVVGPFIFLHKMFTAMNKLSESYNYYG